MRAELFRRQRASICRVWRDCVRSRGTNCAGDSLCKGEFITTYFARHEVLRTSARVRFRDRATCSVWMWAHFLILVAKEFHVAAIWTCPAIFSSTTYNSQPTSSLASIIYLLFYPRLWSNQVICLFFVQFLFSRILAQFWLLAFCKVSTKTQSFSFLYYIWLLNLIIILRMKNDRTNC